MEEIISHFPLCKNLDTNEECIVDVESDVFDTILIVNPISKSKKKLDDETPLLPNSIKPSLSQFTLEQSYSFLKFIQWCVDNYSKIKSVIMNSIGLKNLCQVNAQTVRVSLVLFESILIEFERFNEEEITRIYRESTDEEKGKFLSKILKSD